MTVTFDWLVLLPALGPALAALLTLLADALAPGRRLPALAVSLVGLGAAAAVALRGALGSDLEPAVTLCTPGDRFTGACLWVASPAASALQLAALVVAAAVLLLTWDRHDGDVDLPVQASLVLGASAGACIVIAARDVGSWLVGLELATLPVIALVALRGTRASGHGAMSLLLTSLVSFALLALGAALWVSATGDAMFAPDTARSAWAHPEQRAVLVLSSVVLLAGLGFKLSAAPFHAWTPQVYATAPLPVTVFLAGTSKLAAVGGLLVLLRPFAEVALAGTAPHVVAAAVGGLAVGSMLLGTVVALRATRVTRLLAWSTVAQAGWVLLPLSALSGNGFRAGAAYVLVYAVAATLAFAVLQVVGREDLHGYTGLLRSRPALGAALALALLVLAGLPPGILGLVVKVVAIRPVLDAGLTPLALVAVAAAVLGIAVYLRWLAVLLAEPGEAVRREGEGAAVAEPVGAATAGVVAAFAVLLVLGSVLPALVLGLLS